MDLVAMLPNKNTKVLMGMLMAFIVGESIDLSLEEKKYCNEHHLLSNLKNKQNNCDSVLDTKPPKVFGVNTIAIYSVAISHNPLYIFISGNNNKITRLNVDTGDQIELPTLEDVQGIFKSIAVSIDGRTIASGGSDYDDIYIRNFSDKQQFKRLPQSDVTSVIFSPDGQILVSGSKNGEIKIWDLNTEEAKIYGNIPKHLTGVTSLAISPDGNILASGSENGEIKIWNLNDGKLIYDLKHSTGVTSLAISPDGNILASGSEDGEIKIWNLDTGKAQSDIMHAGRVTSLAINSESNILVSGSSDEPIDGTNDGTIKIWSIGEKLIVPGGKLIETYKLSQYSKEKINLTIRQDKILVSGHDLSHIKIWWVP